MYELVLVLDSFIHWLALYVSTNELYPPSSVYLHAIEFSVNFRVKLLGVLGVRNIRRNGIDVWLCFNTALKY